MHTPGPWRVAYDTRIEYGPILAGEGFAVATILRDPSEWKANARLIAAAPALLEACKRVVAAADAGDDIGDWQIRECREAIAKATGVA